MHRTQYHAPAIPLTQEGIRIKILDQGLVGWFGHQAAKFFFDIPDFQCKRTQTLLTAICNNDGTNVTFF